VSQQGETSELACRKELHSIVKDKDLMDEIAEAFFQAVYDRDDKRCRNFSFLDRLATATSRHAAKAALFDLKRGLASGPVNGGVKVSERAVQALDYIERCLDVREIDALNVLKTLALNALSRCIKVEKQGGGKRAEGAEREEKEG